MKTKLFLLLTVVSFSLKAQVPQEDRETLINFYNATEGSSWINNTNWNTDLNSNSDVSTWHSVTVRNKLKIKNHIKYN